jgi:hypothetical protein
MQDLSDFKILPTQVTLSNGGRAAAAIGARR